MLVPWPVLACSPLASRFCYPALAPGLAPLMFFFLSMRRLGWTAQLEAIILSDGGPAHQDSGFFLLLFDLFA